MSGAESERQDPMSAPREILQLGALMGLCNALTDITAEVDESFLAKYSIGVDQAVRADCTHDGLLQELDASYKVTRMPGGSGFNVLRTVQWMLQKPNVSTFMGCIGDDDSGVVLRQSAEREGITMLNQVAVGTETSYCVILVTGDQRSMCSFQKASGKFSFEQYLEPEYQRCLETASFFYLSGYFLNVCTKTARHLATYAHQRKKPLVMDLGAPRVVAAQSDTVRELVPLADVIFGNAEEMAALSSALKLQVEDVRETCVAFAHLTTDSPSSSPKVIVMTRGKSPVVLATSDSGTFREFPCLPVEPSEIVDVNGAGDAFLGGFLSSYIQHHSVERCIAAGLYAANVIVRQKGCSFPAIRPPLPASPILPPRATPDILENI